MFRRKGHNKRKKHDAELSELRREHSRQKLKIAECLDKLSPEEAKKRAAAALDDLLEKTLKEII